MELPKKTGQKAIYPVSITGVLIMVLYVFAPFIVNHFNLSVFKNWYQLPALDHISTTIMIITIVVFIYLYTDFIFARYWYRKSLGQSPCTSESSSGHTSKNDTEKDDREIIKIHSYDLYDIKVLHILTVLLSSTVFFGLLIFYNKNEYKGEEMALVVSASVVLLTILILYYTKTWFTHFKLGPGTKISNLRKKIGSTNVLESNLDNKFHIFLKKVKLILTSLTIRSKSKDVIARHLKEETSIREQLILLHPKGPTDKISKAELIRTRKELSIYVDYMPSVGIMTVAILLPVIVVIFLTNPSRAFHNSQPVIFFITLLGLVLLFLNQLVVQQDITKSLFHSITTGAKRKFLLCFDFLKKYSIYIIALIVIGIASVNNLNDLPSNNKTSNLECKGDTDCPSNETLNGLSIGKFAEEPKNVALVDCKKLNAVNSKPIVIVAAAGGGIAASAWTAAILAEIESLCPQNVVTAISGVSGGALGAYYHVAHQLLMQRCIKYGVTECNTLVDKFFADPSNEIEDSSQKFNTEKDSRTGVSPKALAARSSLGSVAWGIAAYEPFHLLGLKDEGREIALEKRWESITCKDDKHLEDSSFNLCKEYKSILAGTFDEWRNDANTVSKLLINTATHEHGQRVVFSTDDNFEFQNPRYEIAPNKRYKYSTSDGIFYTGTECLEHLKLVSAARHSATFPYVTPISKIATPSSCEYLNTVMFMDGGYTDNEGIQTALDYLDHLQNMKEKESVQSEAPVIIIRISAFSRNTPVKDNSGTDDSSLLHEITSPVVGIMNTRFAQFQQNTLDVERIRNARHPTLKEFNFIYPDDQLPLSWHLSKQEKNSIFDAADSTRSLLKEGKIKPSKPFCNSTRPNDEFYNSKQMTCLKWYLAGELNWIDRDQVSSEKNLISKLNSNQQTMTSLIGSLKKRRDDYSQVLNNISGIVQTNQLYLGVLTSHFHLPQRWMSAVTPRYCGYGRDPKTIAMSPIFSTGLPASEEWKSKENSDLSTLFSSPKCRTSKTKPTCEQQVIKDYQILMKEEIPQNARIHIIGFASESQSASYNLDLSERRAKWLKQHLLNADLNFQIEERNISTYAFGEDSFLPHPIEADPTIDKPLPVELTQYALAFYCSEQT